MNLIVRETVEVTPPVPWRRELNMPAVDFSGEWWAAKQERLERERREARMERIADVLAHVTFYVFGAVVIAGSLAGYMSLLWLLGE